LAVTSAATHNIHFGVGGQPNDAVHLNSGMHYSWTVHVISTDGVSQLSPVATFSTGIFAPTGGTHTGWTGQFIGMGSSNSSALAPWFRKTFEMPPTPASGPASGPASAPALLYVASVGFCEVTVNGHAVTDGVLLPSISYLPGRVLYRTYDIQAFLNPGANNTIGLWASSGWSQYESFQWAIPLQYKTTPLVSAELHIHQQVVVATDTTWEVQQSTTSHLGNWGDGGFGGDFVDTTLDVPGWDTPAVALASPWLEKATLYPLATNITLSADVMEPTRKHSKVLPLSIEVETVDHDNANAVGCGNVTVTMTEVYTGWFEIKNLQALPHSTIHFYVSSTSGVASEYSMVDGLKLDGSGVGDFRMRFSYHEIHFITIEGLATPPVPTDVVGWRLSVGLENTGAFTSSNALQNKIYDTTVNNYLGLTTGGQTVDCPHRERRGYGGDGHTSYQFALANFQVNAYFTKWARDFSDVQQPNGDIPHTAPTVSGGGGPAWSGFVVTLPWEVFRTYGDTSLLRAMYSTMQQQLSFYTTKTQASDGLLHAWDTSKWDFLGKGHFCVAGECCISVQPNLVLVCVCVVCCLLCVVCCVLFVVIVCCFV
jgi:alpha-L-rhamnosidase